MVIISPLLLDALFFILFYLGFLRKKRKGGATFLFKWHNARHTIDTMSFLDYLVNQTIGYCPFCFLSRTQEDMNTAHVQQLPIKEDIFKFWRHYPSSPFAGSIQLLSPFFSFSPFHRNRLSPIFPACFCLFALFVANTAANKLMCTPTKFQL